MTVLAFPRLDRPWGRMWLLCSFPRLWVKIIQVDKWQRTSLQTHAHRAELHVGLDRWHWKYIWCGHLHRMTTGLYVEIAWGHPREDDITRWDDDYGRHPRGRYPALD